MSDEVRAILEGVGWLSSAFAAGLITHLAGRRQTKQRITTMSADIDAKYREVLESNAALAKRLDEESRLREAAQAQMREMGEQRNKSAEAMATLTLEVQKLTDKVINLERERDQLRQERDDARQAQNTLTTKLEAATKHIAQIEEKFAQMAAENKAFDLIFSRLDLKFANPTTKRSTHVQ